VELAGLDPRRIREEVEHRAILPGTLGIHGEAPYVSRRANVARAAGVLLRPLA
jgi:hypothetical protein